MGDECTRPGRTRLQDAPGAPLAGAAGRRQPRQLGQGRAASRWFSSSVAILASYVSPALNFLDSWQDSKAEHANLAALKQENTRLHERIATLGEPEQAERAARKNGMVGATEGPYVVHGLRR